MQGRMRGSLVGLVHDMKLDYVGVDVARAFDRVVFPHASAER